jgi:ferrochelatase
MRYWHPTSAETAREVAEWAPEEIVCLPLYPQFSTTTTASSLADWRAAAARQGLDLRDRAICCYPCGKGFVETLAALTGPVLDMASGLEEPPRLLLTAHGLPKRIVDSGDPYRDQVEATAAAVITALARPGIDWQICYQSRVGPLEWIGPATDDEIRRAGRQGIPLVVAPISFVCEHSETLVELDQDYRGLAAAAGVPAYYRVPTVGVEPGFIELLASLVRDARTGEPAKGCMSERCAFSGACG